jgi:hypothetical protein
MKRIALPTIEVKLTFDGGHTETIQMPAIYAEAAKTFFEAGKGKTFAQIRNMQGSMTQVVQRIFVPTSGVLLTVEIN